MGTNPINLAIRFLLELTALYAFGRWGWAQHEGAMRFILAIVLPCPGDGFVGHLGCARRPQPLGAGSCASSRDRSPCLGISILCISNLGFFCFRPIKLGNDIWDRGFCPLSHFL